MIYLIDDNKKRQQDSGWSDDKFQEYIDFIYPIYRLSEVTDDLRNELFRSENNVVLFHESFFENIENRQDNDVNDIRNRLEKLSNTTSNKYYVVFSGSNSERKLNDNDKSASIPVHILYNNLEVFIQQYQHTIEYDLKYLLFGTNPDIEPLLLEELNKSKRLFIKENLNLLNELNDYFVFRSRLDVNPLNENHTTIFNKNSQFGLNEIIYKSLSKRGYKGIFVPLCFGSSLSDFNGLRLATEIRCTNTTNQLTSIFIYGFVGIEHLLQNEYFNILKTKNVNLIDYSKKAFQVATSRDFVPITPQELPSEISKLELQPPKNYLNNHSIANEWAIHQWAKTIGCDETDELAKVFQSIEANLYFKYMRTINPISKIDKISPEKLKIIIEGNPKVILIDDEAEKGWYEIFAYLLVDLNNIYVDYIGEAFKSLDSDEIIQNSIDKIKKDDIDVVILDFRLNVEDFENTETKEITSIRLLREIKNLNPGIQVVGFSATSKIWNLQALQGAGIDGFIFKDGGENIHQNILNLIAKVASSIQKASWLKPLSENFSRIVENCTNPEIEFKRSLKSNLEISFELLEQSFTKPKYLNYAYLQLFLCIEDFLRLKSIFEYGDKCYLNPNVLTYKKIGDKKWKSILKYHPSVNQNPSYFSYEENEVDQSNINTDFKMSCVLVFLFNKDNSNFLNWPKIRDIRNKKAAHPEKGNVNQGEINEIVTFIETVINRSNFQVPTKKGLNDEIDPNSLAALKERFR